MAIKNIYTFLNIHLKRVVNTLTPFKNLKIDSNIFDEKNIKHHITYLKWI